MTLRQRVADILDHLFPGRICLRRQCSYYQLWGEYLHVAPLSHRAFHRAEEMLADRENTAKLYLEVEGYVPYFLSDEMEMLSRQLEGPNATRSL